MGPYAKALPACIDVSQAFQTSVADAEHGKSLLYCTMAMRIYEENACGGIYLHVHDIQARLGHWQIVLLPTGGLARFIATSRACWPKSILVLLILDVRLSNQEAFMGLHAMLDLTTKVMRIIHAPLALQC